MSKGALERRDSIIKYASYNLIYPLSIYDPFLRSLVIFALGSDSTVAWTCEHKTGSINRTCACNKWHNFIYFHDKFFHSIRRMADGCFEVWIHTITNDCKRYMIDAMKRLEERIQETVAVNSGMYVYNTDTSKCHDPVGVTLRGNYESAGGSIVCLKRVNHVCLCQLTPFQWSILILCCSLQ